MHLNTFTLIRSITKALELISPSLAMRWASRLFFSPRETQRQIPNIPDLSLSWCNYTKTSGRKSRVQVYSSGTGPVVLLIHGWEGASFSHSILATKLVESGFKVVLFDIPAHGLSPDKITNFAEVNNIIQRLEAKENGFYALVGHSFGAACEGYAIGKGIEIQKFVSIAAPTTVGFMINRFCKIIGASDKIKQGLIDQIESFLETPHEQASLETLSQAYTVSGLIIHDREDKTVPYRHAKKFAAAWPDARFVTTEGLGHSRILKAPKVTQIVAEFLIHTDKH